MAPRAQPHTLAAADLDLGTPLPSWRGSSEQQPPQQCGTPLQPQAALAAPWAQPHTLAAADMDLGTPLPSFQSRHERQQEQQGSAPAPQPTPPWVKDRRLVPPPLPPPQQQQRQAPPPFPVSRRPGQEWHVQSAAARQTPAGGQPASPSVLVAPLKATTCVLVQMPGCLAPVPLAAIWPGCMPEASVVGWGWIGLWCCMLCPSSCPTLPQCT